MSKHDMTVGRIEFAPGRMSRFVAAQSATVKVDNDRGPFISTYTGRFYPFSPRASEVSILDIAHSLAMQCRYSGHGRRDLSVAEHSVRVCRWVYKKTGSKQDALSALLHDAPEALSGFGDVQSPVKRHATDYHCN